MDELLFGRVIDAALDENGERQAQLVANRLTHAAGLLIEASPRRRTQQTAQTIASATHAELLTSPLVDELDFGRWSGQRFLALAEDRSWRRWNDERDTALTPAGDSISKVQSRVARHLYGLQAAFPNRTIAIVSHAEVIRSTLLWVLRLPANAYRKLDIDPASITTLLWRDGAFAVHSVNEHAYA